jgi:hypothetical protein
MKTGPILIQGGEVSADTIECLARLLEQAKRGEVLGLAFGVILRRSNYTVHTTGEARRNPTFTRGVLAALDDHLSDAVHGRET